MARRLRGWAGAALLAAGPAVAAEPSELFLRASEAARQMNYHGVVVYRDARTLEVLRLVHRYKDGRVQERLTSLTGQPRDMVREGDHVSCLVAGAPALRSLGVPQELLPAMSRAVLDRVANHYEVRDTGPSRVAGRGCRAVALAPRDDYRYGYEVCADDGTGVPLRVSLLDRRGEAVEQVVFTEVAFPAFIDDSAFRLPPGAVPATRPGAHGTPVSTAPAWDLARLPPGFEVILRRRLPGDAAVEHVVVSDGLSTVSVFGGQSAASSQLLRGLSRMGAMSAYGRAVGALHVMVLGEVPEGTVRLIGDGFSPQRPDLAAP
jgi:sigma-E factor negative regulatory protein RseB